MAATRFVAKCIVLESAGKFLLLTRSGTHPALAGLSDLPGGMVEPGEEPGDAVKREIQEETGLTVAAVDVLYATTMLVGDTSYPTLLYAARLTEEEPEVTVSWEHSAYEWAELDRMAEVEPQLAPTYREAMSYLRENQILDGLK